MKWILALMGGGLSAVFWKVYVDELYKVNNMRLNRIK